MTVLLFSHSVIPSLFEKILVFQFMSYVKYTVDRPYIETRA